MNKLIRSHEDFKLFGNGILRVRNLRNRGCEPALSVSISTTTHEMTMAITNEDQVSEDGRLHPAAVRRHTSVVSLANSKLRRM